MEGYYDNTIFHRIVPGFIVQGGDPTGTGDGGESIYGGAFKDEFHSRLRFLGRGMVAMANEGSNSNRSQFFITLDKTQWLNYRNTIFGKLSGNTIFNALKMAEVELGPNDRPLVPPKLFNVSIVVNPFDDIIPRELVKQEKAPDVQHVRKQKPKKSFLSFETEEDDTLQMQSIHDLQVSEKYSSQPIPIAEAYEELQQKRQDAQAKAEKIKQRTKIESIHDFDEQFDKEMRNSVLSSRKPQHKETQPKIDSVDIGKYSVSQSIDNRIKILKQPDPGYTEEEESELLLKLKQNRTGTNNPEILQEKRDEETFLSPLELRRYKFHQYKTNTKGREGETLSRLNSFISNISEGQDQWYNAQLKFGVDSSRAYAFGKKGREEVSVEEPRKKQRLEEEDSYQQEELADMLSYEALLDITKE